MKIHKIGLGVLAMMMLAGCELKEELWGSDGEAGKGAVGKAELSVSVKKPLSMSRAEVSTADYPVLIQGVSAEVADITKEYANAAAASTGFVLPVGIYDVSSHTPGDLVKQMTAPYYAGSTKMEIKKDVITKADVICKMQNSRISLKYNEDFLEAFDTWTITINDGSDKVLSYTEQTLTPADVFWYFGEEEVTSIRVDIVGTTKAGNSINESRDFKKANAISETYGNVSEYFEGGDALVVTMGAVGASSGLVTNITINTHITFENFNEQVEIPTNDPITITEDGTAYLGTGIQLKDTDTEYPTMSMIVDVLAGMQNFYVKAASDNADFTAYAAGLGLTSENGLDLVGATGTDVDALFPGRPALNDKKYTYTLAPALLQEMQEYVGVHTLTFVVYDILGNALSRELTVTVTEESSVDETLPTLICKDAAGNNIFETGVDYSMEAENWPTETDVIINTPKGLKSLKVTIIAGNEGFDGAAKDLHFQERDLVGDTELFPMLQSLGVDISAPESGSTQYIFPIHSFYVMMNLYGPTVDADQTDYDPDGVEAHLFKLTAEDNEGNVVGPVEISVTIRK